ncbi:MAG: protein kinase [Pirellulaceae bacterium]
MNDEQEISVSSHRLPGKTRQLTTSVGNSDDAGCVLDGDENVDVGSRYQLLNVIDYGGMGIVYRANDRQLNRRVAIKVLRADRVGNELAEQGIANEVRMMSFLSHPGVATIFDTGKCKDGRQFYVMKLVEGRTFMEMLHDDSIPTSRSLQVFADICQAIASAHARGVLHLDLKPGNVMVGQFGETYVMDWGLAQFYDRDAGLDDEHDPSEIREATSCTINGTLEYMSPEQAMGRKLDPRADVFGLGAILCRILIGRSPYEGHDVKRMYRLATKASMQSVLDDLEQRRVDHRLARLVRSCLARSRSQRPKNAIEVYQAISDYHEAALQQMESDMSRFFELSLDMFCIADLNGYFRRVNSNFSRVLGYSEADLLSQPFLNFVHPDDVQRTIKQMRSLDKGKSVVRFRNRYRTANGEFRKLEWTAKTIADENVIFAVARDVTGKRR